MSPAISIKNTEARLQNRNLVGATVNAPGAELAESSNTTTNVVIIVLLTLLLSLAANVSFAVLTMMFFLTVMWVGSQPSSPSPSYPTNNRYQSSHRTWPTPSPERPGYHRMVRAGGKYRPWVKDR